MPILTDNDVRIFKLVEGVNYEVILYQVDLLRILKLLNSVNSKRLAQKIRRMIFIRDFNEGTRTDFSRDKIPGCEVERYIMSPMDYKKYVDCQRELDSRLEAFYKVKIKK